MASNYVANPVIVELSGFKFQSFKTEDGQVVFSQSSCIKGLGVPRATFIDNLTKLGCRENTNESPKELPGKTSKMSGKLKTSVNNRPISVVTMGQLLEIITHFASKGYDIPVAMQTANMMTDLQRSVDRAYGTLQSDDTYKTAQEQAADFVLEQRMRLRKLSGARTNKVLACNTYSLNNDLIYGEGKNRDTYEGEDAAEKHYKEHDLEVAQTTMKALGFDVQTIRDKSPEIYDRLIK